MKTMARYLAYGGLFAALALVFAVTAHGAGQALLASPDGSARGGWNAGQSTHPGGKAFAAGL